MASNSMEEEINNASPIVRKHIKDANAQRLLEKIDELEHLKAEAQDVLLDVVYKRKMFPALIASNFWHAEQSRIKRVEDTELCWVTKNKEETSIEKELEVIADIEEAAKENAVLERRLEELQRLIEEAERIVKLNDETIRKMF